MTKEQRVAEWDATFIACRIHPERRCNRSKFVHARMKVCASCSQKKSDGSLLPSKLNKLRKYQKTHKAQGNIRTQRYYYSDKGQICQAWKIERQLHG